MLKADAPKVDPAKTSKPAAVATAAAGNVSVQGKKDKAKPTQTKVDDPPETNRGGSCHNFFLCIFLSWCSD